MAAGTEWVGGIVAMPAYVTGEGEPYRPRMLLWMIPGGPVLGTTMEKAEGPLLQTAGERLRSAIDAPMVPGAPPPVRVRVASPELADALRGTRPALEIVCAPTPELDDVIASMRQHLDGDAETEQSYLDSDVGPDAVGAFFRAAAALYRAKPWKVVPDDTSILALTIEKLGVENAVVSVIGQMGRSHGVIVFRSHDDFEAFLDAADAVECGETPAMPPHFSINFERGADMTAALRKEIAQHRWEVAGPRAFPWLVAVDEDVVARPPTANEVTLGEALSLALAQVVAEKEALAAAFAGGEPMIRTLSTRTHAGEIDVALRAPYASAVRTPGPIPLDVLGALSELEADGGELDEDRRTELEEELVRRFADSAEARGLRDVRWCHTVMDLAASHLGVTIASVGAPELREILYELLPRKVSVAASAAGDIVAECRAFFAFMKRELSLRDADACLRLLGAGAVKKLEAALSDRRNFGMAKSIMMAGADAGFDMSSTEGVEAWMREIQGKPLPSSIQLPPLGVANHPMDPKAARAKRNQRKAARRARKKNR
jgi:hypothetical protein